MNAPGKETIADGGAVQDAVFNAERTLQQQAHVVIPPPVQEKGQGCDCRIPPDAARELKWTRAFSIAVIVSHALALATFGVFCPAQLVASLCGIIAGGVLLCCYNKCVYTCTPIVFSIAAVFDVFAVVCWLSGDNESSRFIFIPPLLALMVTIPAIACGFKACSSWDVGAGISYDQLNATVPTASATLGIIVQEIPQAHLQV